MIWEIIIAAAVGVILSYLFRYQVGLQLTFREYLWFQWPALAKGIVGAAAVILLWGHIGTALNWLLGFIDKSFEWPPMAWEIAAVVGFAGRKIYEVAPQGFKYVAAFFGKKFAA